MNDVAVTDTVTVPNTLAGLDNPDEAALAARLNSLFTEYVAKHRIPAEFQLVFLHRLRVATLSYSISARTRLLELRLLAINVIGTAALHIGVLYSHAFRSSTFTQWPRDKVLLPV